jgi:hypothetical protein
VRVERDLGGHADEDGDLRDGDRRRHRRAEQARERARNARLERRAAVPLDVADRRVAVERQRAARGGRRIRLVEERDRLGAERGDGVAAAGRRRLEQGRADAREPRRAADRVEHERHGERRARRRRHERRARAALRPERGGAERHLGRERERARGVDARHLRVERLPHPAE